MQVLRHALESHQVKFTNELGNPISVQVSDKPIDGVRAADGKAMKHMPGVLIVLEGPTSTSENHITRLEAEKLFEELKRVLGK